MTICTKLSVLSLSFGVLFGLWTTSVAAIDLLPDFGFLKSGGEKNVREIWSHQDQFVRIEPIDQPQGGLNDQPVELSAKDISKALSAIQIWQRSILIGLRHESRPVFVASELRLLGRALSQGLAEAGPGEDVTFAVTGVHGGTLTKERKGIAGRVFYKEGKLNVIFGDLLRDIDSERSRAIRGGNDKVDRRLYPFHVGMRAKPRPHAWRIVDREGLSFAGEVGSRRDDWVKLELTTLIAGVEQEAIPDALRKEQKRMREAQRRLSDERREMRVEMARMRKEFGLSGATGGNALEQRLARLEALKRKGLISQQEYTAKRTAILDQL